MEFKLENGRGLYFRAIPVDGAVGISVGENGVPQPLWPKVLSLPGEASGFLRDKTSTWWFSRQFPIRVSNVPWVINGLGDPDSYPDALATLDHFAHGKIPILNHPRAICMTRRDLIAQPLSEVAGLNVPKCCRVMPEEFGDFEKAFLADDFVYPVFVQPVRAGVGQDILRIDSAEDWQNIRLTAWYKVPHFMTQGVDPARMSGKNLQVRVCFVGGVSFIRKIRTSAYGEGGNGQGDASSLPPAQVAQLVKELIANEAFKAICEALPPAVGLDLFAVDIDFDLGNDRFVLAECSAGLEIFDGDQADGAGDLDRALKAPIATAVKALLQRPGHWGRFLPETLKASERSFTALYTGSDANAA